LVNDALRRAESASGPEAALILAAGASQRFGGEPKALLPVGGETAIQRIVRLARESGLTNVVVVVGRHGPEIRRSLAGDPVIIVENLDWVLGRTGSIQEGLNQIDPETSVTLWPVDHPFVKPSTVERVLQTSRGDFLTVWTIPTFEGRGGHPVVLKPPVLREIRRVGRSVPLRALIPHFGPQVRRIAVEDFGVTAAVDTPEEYSKFLPRWESAREDSWTAG
jgi:molybdenum cofactor cytidylyltransferase